MKNKSLFLALGLIVLVFAFSSGLEYPNVEQPQQEAVLMADLSGDVVTDLALCESITDVTSWPLEVGDSQVTPESYRVELSTDLAAGILTRGEPVILKASLVPAFLMPGDDNGIKLPNWVKNNWVGIVSGLLAFMGIVVRLTPTKLDDTILSVLIKIIDVFIPNLKKGGGKHPSK